MIRSNKIYPITFKKSEKIYNNKSCSICLEKINNNDIKNATLECGHIFHSDCILKWIENKSNCPICRAKFRFKLKKNL